MRRGAILVFAGGCTNDNKMCREAILVIAGGLLQFAYGQRQTETDQHTQRDDCVMRWSARLSDLFNWGCA